MAGKPLRDDTVRALGADMEDELFGPGGYEQFVENHANDFAKSISRRTVQILPSSQASQSDTQTPSTVPVPLSPSPQPSSKGTRPNKKPTVPALRRPSPQPSGKESRRNKKPKTGDSTLEKEHTDVPEDARARRQVRKPTQAGVKEQATLAPAQSPTFPLSRVSLHPVESPSSASTSSHRSATNRAYVAVPSPKSQTRKGRK